MSKKRKNSNYKTTKTEKESMERARAKKRKKLRGTLICITVTVAVLAALVAAAVAFIISTGIFGYKPEATYHAEIKLLGYGSLHVELYGNEAPITVENFISLASSGYFNGKALHTVTEKLAYLGSTSKGGDEGGIMGEFPSNEVDNRISHTRGVISMSRTEDYNSAYGQFFIVRSSSTELDGKYAAFGFVTSGMDIIDEIYAKVDSDDATGEIAPIDQPIISGITVHAVH